MTHSKQNTGLRRLLLFAGVVGLWSCNNSGPSHTEQEAPAWADTSAAASVSPLPGELPGQFAPVTEQVYTLYLKIGDALVRDNSDEAAAAADQLVAVPPVSNADTTAAARAQQYNSYMQAIAKSAAVIAKGDINQQRLAFGSLSGDMFELMKAFGSDKPVYQVYCPMAFDNRGGNWLSDRAVIRNPYYGSDMLECGDIVAIIRKGSGK